MIEAHILQKVNELLDEHNFSIAHKDTKRPWGGYFVIDEKQAAKFAAYFFPNENFESLKITDKLSPKILMVAPGKRLSWQYHHRRAETWICIGGTVKVVTSNTDVEGEAIMLHENDIVRLIQGQRHRLIGTDEWGIIAEIWQHTDVDNPSDEDDIVRLQDDFGR